MNLVVDTMGDDSSECCRPSGHQSFVQCAVTISVDEINEHRIFLSDPLNYSNVINHPRCYTPKTAHHCVMCGQVGVAIPRQNKDVCKSCDSTIWLLSELDLVFKFCKGCKNFLCLADFAEKPESSKCSKCRHRGRQNYFARKGSCRSSSEDSLCEMDSPTNDADDQNADEDTLEFVGRDRERARSPRPVALRPPPLPSHNRQVNNKPTCSPTDVTAVVGFDDHASSGVSGIAIGRCNGVTPLFSHPINNNNNNINNNSSTPRTSVDGDDDYEEEEEGDNDRAESYADRLLQGVVSSSPPAYAYGYAYTAGSNTTTRTSNIVNNSSYGQMLFQQSGENPLMQLAMISEKLLRD